jgi:hypothetical protein
LTFKIVDINHQKKLDRNVVEQLQMGTKFNKRLEQYDQNHPKSRRELRSVVRKLGDGHARLLVPMLHPDHIRFAAIVFEDLAKIFDEIAGKRITNIQKVLTAKAVLKKANDDLENYARDDMSYVYGLRSLFHDRRET